jgi:hypothetical protein
MALRQPDTALQQPHRGSGLQQIKKKYFSVGVISNGCLDPIFM